MACAAKMIDVPESQTPALIAQNIRVQYGKTVAVTGSDIMLNPGTICGLIGANGSGKSSLFKALMGVVPGNGEITVYGQDAKLARKNGLVGYMPQSEQLDWNFPLNVTEVVEQGRYGALTPARKLKKTDHTLVRAAIERVELSPYAKRQIGALSGGQRKRAFLARALAQNARLLLLDEPFAGVDQPTATTISKLLRELAAEGRSILISTHDLAGVPELCDEVILFNKQPLIHDTPERALQPERIAAAFGFAHATATAQDSADTLGQEHPDAPTETTPNK